MYTGVAAKAALEARAKSADAANAMPNIAIAPRSGGARRTDM
jgi:hypothetical protein